YMTNPEFRDLPENKPKRWKAALALGLKQFSGALAQGASLENALGQLGGAAAMGATVPKVYADLQHQQKIDQIDQNIARREALEDQNISQAKKIADIENIKIDNDRQEQVRKDRITKAEEDRKQKAYDNAWNSIDKAKKFDAANLSEAQKKRYADVGINPDELPTFDFTNPVLKKVDGDTFKWDGEKFVQTNLPTDNKEKLIDFDVTLRNGKTEKYRVTEEKAASLRVQLERMGASVDLAQARNAISYANVAARREQFLKNYQLKVQKGNLDKVKEEAQIRKDLKAGILDEDTANAMIAALK
ncbi:MAG: hypothetical protein KDB79_16555, partial [Acidobacteria bacterium]|nr:hypothetical protein [Acidobacteriota bacterium]